MTPFAFLLGHGSRGKLAAARAAALLQPAETVRTIDSPEQTEAALAEVAAGVPGNAELRVIHLIEIDDQGVQQGLKATAQAVRSIQADWPAVRLVQFAVALVDRTWDDDERQALAQLGDFVLSVLVISRSNEAAVSLTVAEEEAMAADIAVALAISDMAKGVSSSAFWLVGASAVYYRKRWVLSILTAHHVAAFLDETLLSELPPIHTECEAAKVWVNEGGLARGEHLQLLARGETGGSLISEIKLDHQLFRDVPPELLIDSLRSFTMESADRMVRAAVEQIERNRAAHLTSLLVAIEQDVIGVLIKQQRIASSERYLKCLREALDERLKSLRIAVSAHNTESEDDATEQLAIEQALAGIIENLPYPVAVAARALGLGAAGLAGYHLLAAVTTLDPNYAVLGLLGGLALGTPLLMTQQNRVQRIAGLRERYLRLAERRMQRAAAYAVLEAAIQELQALQQGIDSVAKRVRALNDSVLELRQRYRLALEKRLLRGLTQTRLSLVLPTAADLPVSELVEQYPLPAGSRLPEQVMGVLLPDDKLVKVDVDAVDECLIEAVADHVSRQVWPDLDELLKGSTATRKTANSVLTASTAPIVGDDPGTGDPIRRMTTLPHEPSEVVLEVLTEQGPGQAGLNGETWAREVDPNRHPTSYPDTLIRVASRPVPASMLPGRGAADDQ